MFDHRQVINDGQVHITLTRVAKEQTNMLKCGPKMCYINGEFIFTTMD
jgi:hypothetical protein